MIKIALFALPLALLAGALGLPGLSDFAFGVSKFLFSVVGLIILVSIALIVLFYRRVTA